MVAIKYFDKKERSMEKNIKSNDKEHGIINNFYIIKRPNKKIGILPNINQIR